LLSLLALTPLLTIGVLLVGFRMPAKRAMAIAYGVTLLIAWGAWRVPFPVIVAASLQGLILAVSLVYIIFGALLLLATLTQSGAVNSIREEIAQLLHDIRKENIENIVALRGDPPQGETEFKPLTGGYRYGNELVEQIREFGGFGIAVAGYPEKHIEAPDLETDLQHLKRKVDAGADLIITQLFYDNRFFYEFVERCRAVGITKPIVPGLLPILNVEQIKRITRICGSTIPTKLLHKLTQAGDDRKKVHKIGIRHTVAQAQDLLAHGVPGIHFYVLNQYFHIAEIMEQIQPALHRLTGNTS